jgi:hypothetical protein
VWWLLCQAFSNAYKLRSAIHEKKEPDLPHKEAPQPGETKEQEEARDATGLRNSVHSV